MTLECELNSLAPHDRVALRATKCSVESNASATRLNEWRVQSGRNDSVAAISSCASSTDLGRAMFAVETGRCRPSS
jgi:hypothetical protein